MVIKPQSVICYLGILYFPRTFVRLTASYSQFSFIAVRYTCSKMTIKCSTIIRSRFGLCRLIRDDMYTSTVARPSCDIDKKMSYGQNSTSNLYEIVNKSADYSQKMLILLEGYRLIITFDRYLNKNGKVPIRFSR